MFHNVVLDNFMVKNSLISLNVTTLDNDSSDSNVELHTASSRLQQGDKEMDFTTDVTELETFGSVDMGVSSHTPLSDSPGSTQCSLKKSLLDRMKIEKQIINATSSAKFGSSSDEVSHAKKKKVSNEEESDVSLDSDNKFKTSTGAQHTTTTSNDSDSDDSKLVIDIDCKMSKCDNPPSANSTPSVPRQRKSARKISKDVDPLGQILKMQTQLLKTDTKKVEHTSSQNVEKSELTPHAQQVPPSSSLESPNKVEASHSSNNKSILPSDLMALQEDAEEYAVEPEENCAYKLFSLDDMLLLLKSTVHTIKTRSLKKPFKLQIPAFVLTKVNYQTCYGVESLTESELCRLWTESLVHSKCELYVGHVDAITSKFFMLEQIAVENMKESMNTFKSVNCLNSLRHILKWVTGLQEGSYLLSHVSGDSSVYLYKNTQDNKRGTYNLHEAHCNAPKEPSSLSVPWVPLNPNLLLKFHIQHGRPPCTFPPAPEKDTGISKLNQPRKAPCQEKTDVLPATGATKVIAKNTIRNRLQRLKAKQKAQKAKAALQVW